MEPQNNFYNAKMQEVSDLLANLGFSTKESRVTLPFIERCLFSKRQRTAFEKLRSKLDQHREYIYCYSGEIAIRRERNQFGVSLFLCLAMNKSEQYILYFREDGLVDSPCLTFDKDLTIKEICKIISEIYNSHTLLHWQPFSRCFFNLLVGDKVMMLADKQSPDGAYIWLGGDYGTVEEISLTSLPWVEVRLDNGTAHRFEALSWDQYEPSVNIESATGKVYIPKSNGGALWLPFKLANLII